MRAALAFLLVAALLALPTPWVAAGPRSLLALSAVLMLLIGLFFLAHWVLEKLAPAPHEPFVPRHDSPADRDMIGSEPKPRARRPGKAA